MPSLLDERWLGRLTPYPPAPPPPSTSRAGRNLPAAIATATVLILAVGLSLFVVIDLFVLLVIAFMVVGLWEASGALRARSIVVPVTPLWVASLLIPLLTWRYAEVGLFVSFFASGLLLIAWRIGAGGTWAGRDTLAGIFALAWVGLLGAFAVLLAASAHGPWAVVTFVLLPVMNDTGGYVAGILFGKHPMAPTISPKKSWEGFAGSLTWAVLAGIVCAVLALDIPWWWGIILGVACTIAATIGDLSESLLKRDLGVKDMGSIFPGHGGVLDRVDSILVCAPVVYAILALT